jgi:hypothetical protein
MNLITRLRALRRDTAGQDLLEYALLVALIALVAYAAKRPARTSTTSSPALLGSSVPRLVVVRRGRR